MAGAAQPLQKTERVEGRGVSLPRPALVPRGPCPPSKRGTEPTPFLPLSLALLFFEVPILEPATVSSAGTHWPLSLDSEVHRVSRCTLGPWGD